MRRVDLTPRPRLQTRAHKRHVLRWGKGLILYFGVLVLVFFLCGSMSAGDARAMSEQGRGVARRAALANTLVLGVHEELLRAEQELLDAGAIGEQPDWGLVLTLLASEMGEDVVLKSCRLQPLKSIREMIPAGEAPADGGEPARIEHWRREFRVELNGFAVSQKAASQFMLRLETLGLFDRVSLVRTSREDFRGETAIAFQIDCALGGAKDGRK